MKILYLHSEVMGYTVATLRELVNTFGAELHVVYRDKETLTPYIPDRQQNFHLYRRSEHDAASLKTLAESLNPDLVVVSGWIDRAYLATAKMLRKTGVAVVTGCDNQWKGTFKQRVATIVRPYVNTHFSHIWVAGAQQYEFARRLGYSQNQIIFNMYSADTQLFNAAHARCVAQKQVIYPKQFVFVGRLAEVKGLDVLLEAWKSIAEQRNGWTLKIVGNGPLRERLAVRSDLELIDFLHPSRLTDIVSTAGCFLLPSNIEPWGVVLHEFAAAGLPIICSDVCGAASTFVVDGYNGFTFASGNSSALASQMLKIVASSPDELRQMSSRSHALGQRISTQTSAASLCALCAQKIVL